MGLIFLKKEKNCSIGVWEISESVNELKAFSEEVKFDQIKSGKSIFSDIFFCESCKTASSYECQRYKM